MDSFNSANFYSWLCTSSLPSATKKLLHRNNTCRISLSFFSEPRLGHTNEQVWHMSMVIDRTPSRINQAIHYNSTGISSKMMYQYRLSQNVSPEPLELSLSMYWTLRRGSRFRLALIVNRWMQIDEKDWSERRQSLPHDWHQQGQWQN